MELKKGILFHNRYALVSHIGSGASAQVWEARDTKANNLIVALKIYTETSGMSSYGLQHFETQFTTVYNMKHSNLLPPTGYDVCDGCPYLVMQYCENGSCTGMATRMDEEDIIKFLHDVSAGLEYLHDHNIIHQDIKPDNIMLDDNCNFMVTDFGISVAADTDLYDSAGMSGGTRAYMGPERFEGTTVTASDMWSLGASIVELIIGNPPYGDHGGLLQTQGEPLPELPDNLQPEVRSMILSCLERDPNKRITASEMRRKIELYWETGAWQVPSQRKTVAIVATAIAAVLMCVGIFLWDYNRTKVYYYKDYTEQWGVPQGIGRVFSWQAYHMNRVYRFEYTHGKLHRVSHVNSRDIVIVDNESERAERPWDQELFYTSDGKLSRVKVRDNNGKVLYVKSYNENLSRMTFQYDDKHNTERAIASNTVAYGRMLEDNSAKHGKITRWLLEYDKNGYVKRVKFAAADNSPVGDDNNIYGREMTYDAKGRVVEVHYLGRNDEPMSTKWGLGIKKFFYDSDDNWVRAEYFAPDGTPALDDSDGVSVYVMEYDKNDNVVSAYYNDGDGNPMITKKQGYAGVSNVFDDRGFPVKTMILDVDRNPMFIPKEGCAGYTREFDDNGFVIRQVSIDTEGNPCNAANGVGITTTVNDNHGNVLEEWFHDLDGELCLNDAGIAGYTGKYDSVGNQIEIINYDISKIPTLSSEGYAGVRYGYEERGLLTEQVNLDTLLNPAYDYNHISIARYEYDSRGNTTRIAFFDPSGEKLVLSNENVAGWNMKYDDLGNEVERTFFNENNAPCAVKFGYARLVHTYDKNGFLQSDRYYDINGALTLVKGIAGTDYVCDERGNTVVERPVSTNGQLAPGQYEMHYKYDAFDNPVEVSYFRDGATVVNKEGYHKAAMAYNSRNQMVEICYYDKTSQLVSATSEKVAIVRYEYDSRGNRVKCSYFGVDSKPCEGREHWASSTYEHDVFGNITRQCFFDVNGKPTDPAKMVPVGICEYDKHGNMTMIGAQDGNGNYIKNNEGWAIQRMGYDNRSQLLWRAYYGPDEKPIAISEGCHRATYKHDNRGNIVEVAYFGVDDKPCLVDGYHVEKMDYDDRGNLVQMAVYNTEGKPVDAASGFHRVVITNDNGTQVLRKYYTAQGTLFATQTYNKNTNEWSEMRGAAAAPTQERAQQATSGSATWRDQVRQFNAKCPKKISAGVYLQSVAVSGNSVNAVIKFSEYSKYDMDDEKNSNVSSQKASTRNAIRDAAAIPSNVVINVSAVDKANRSI